MQRLQDLIMSEREHGALKHVYYVSNNIDFLADIKTSHLEIENGKLSLRDHVSEGMAA